MERNQWADRFTDNVVRRTERDSDTSVYVVFLLLCIPMFLAIVFSFFVVETNQDIFDSMDIIEIAFSTIFVSECCIAGFLLYSYTRTDHDHQARDVEWMDALIGYVGSKGGDTSDMERIRKGIRTSGWSVKKAFSGAMLLVDLAILAVIGIAAFLNVGMLADRLFQMLLVCYAVLLIQFVFTVSTTVRFPFRHDRVQCEFTEALSVQLRGIGIPMEPMDRSVRRSYLLIHILLFIVTLGLYSCVLLLLTSYLTSRHIKTQWKYEQRLMMEIISFEGGVGIEGIGSNQPKGAVARFLKNLI